MGHFSEAVQPIFAERKNLLQHTADFKNFAPDLVLDMIPSKEEDARILLDTFRGICHRIVAISSQDVYRAYGLVRKNETRAGEPVPVTEQSHLREKLYPYQDTAQDKNAWANTYDKILVERVIMGNKDYTGTVLRLPAVHGPHDGQHRFYSYLNLKRMHDKRPLIVDSQRIREELGYREPVNREEGIRKTIEWELATMPQMADPKFHLHLDYAKEDEIVKQMGLF